MSETTKPTDTGAPAALEAAPPAGRRLPVWVIVMAFVLLASFMALVGWGLNRAMRGSIQIGDPVPQFSAVMFDGKSFNSNDHAGKVVFINFWASWCQPCAQEAAELEAAYQHYKPSGNVTFIGLTYVDTEPNSLAYIKQFGITYPNGPDLATKISQMFRVRGVPETFIIDQNGRLAYFKAGPFQSTDEIISVVDGILKK